MPTSTVTTKGQITIPKEVRDRMGSDAGDRVSFRVRDDGVAEMEPIILDLFSLFGTLEPKDDRRVTLAEIQQAVEKGGTRS